MAILETIGLKIIYYVRQSNFLIATDWRFSQKELIITRLTRIFCIKQSKRYINMEERQKKRNKNQFDKIFHLNKIYFN